MGPPGLGIEATLLVFKACGVALTDAWTPEAASSTGAQDKHWTFIVEADAEARYSKAETGARANRTMVAHLERGGINILLKGMRMHCSSSCLPVP